MSIEQKYNSLNQLNNEVAFLEKKLADLMKKEADKNKRIYDTQKTITKSTSASMVQSKMRQIDNYTKELTKILSEKADVNKK
ncbi:MAG: toll/interleukin-1 receptor domain-containing protein, partial [Treponema sp.]|nr:toll/interleukin-1 receptor domain-containing protein [Treponema sp.]